MLASVARTGRCVIVHEAPRTGGFGAEIAAVLADEGLFRLLAPVKRVTGYDTVIPLARLESAYLPDDSDRRRGAPGAGVPVTVFHLPDLGEGLKEAEIVTWHVGAGDHVVADQPLASVETDKAVVEMPSPRAGTIAAVHGEPGDIVAVGTPLVTFDDGGGSDAGSVVGRVPEAPSAGRAAPRDGPWPAVWASTSASAGRHRPRGVVTSGTCRPRRAEAAPASSRSAAFAGRWQRTWPGLTGRWCRRPSPTWPTWAGGRRRSPT